METLTATGAAEPTLDAYVAVAKPRGILPHFLTAAAAMFLGAGGVPPLSTMALTLLGGGLVAAAANTLNSILDRDIDALMARTRNRPLPSGRITPNQALGFALIAGLAGTVLLAGIANMGAVILAIIALGYYVLPYTLWLKRRTYWSAVVGSAIGAIPPFIGWIVVTSRLGPTPFLLAAIIILWTLPHFWALAIFRRGDYARAGLTMLPETGTVIWIMVCSSLLVAASLVLAKVAGLGPIYTAVACLSGAGLLYLTLRLRRRQGFRPARQLYAYSILYIAVLFGAMILDRMIQGI
jgi:protoheme IX farnesyltransferase